MMEEKTKRNSHKTFFKALKIRRSSYQLNKLVVFKSDNEVFSL